MQHALRAQQQDRVRERRREGEPRAEQLPAPGHAKSLRREDDGDAAERDQQRHDDPRVEPLLRHERCEDRDEDRPEVAEQLGCRHVREVERGEEQHPVDGEDRRPTPTSCRSLRRAELAELAQAAGGGHDAEDDDGGEQHPVEDLDDRCAVGGAQRQRDRAPDETGRRDAQQAGQRVSTRRGGRHLADPGQLLTDEHVHDATRAERRLHVHAAGRAFGDLADDRGVLAVGRDPSSPRARRRPASAGTTATILPSFATW